MQCPSKYAGEEAEGHEDDKGSASDLELQIYLSVCVPFRQYSLGVTGNRKPTTPSPLRFLGSTARPGASLCQQGRGHWKALAGERRAAALEGARSMSDQPPNQGSLEVF